MEGKGLQVPLQLHGGILHWSVQGPRDAFKWFKWSEIRIFCHQCHWSWSAHLEHLDRLIDPQFFSPENEAWVDLVPYGDSFKTNKPSFFRFQLLNPAAYYPYILSRKVVTLLAVDLTFGKLFPTFEGWLFYKNLPFPAFFKKGIHHFCFVKNLSNG